MFKLFYEPVLWIHRYRQIIFLTCYNENYYMDPETAKLSILRLFKFDPRLILRWGIRKCHNFDPNCLRSPLRIVFPHACLPTI